MLTAQADFQHHQDINPGLTTGMTMLVTRHIAAVQQIVTTGAT